MENSILLNATEKEIFLAVKYMYNDPKHINIDDTGQVNGNVVFTYLNAFHPDSSYVSDLKARYQKGGLGDGATKKILEKCL